MQFLNKIEIQGIVGNSSIQKVADTRLCRLSVVTELAYKGNDGFEGPGICNLDAITRGAIVHIIGRLKCNRYVDANGNDRVQYEIVAQKLDVMKEDRV